MLMSATKGFNKNIFLDEVSEMVAKIMGKSTIELQYPAWEHEIRVKWLLQHAKITDPSNFKVDDDGSKITMNVLMDEVTYFKYLKEFEPETFKKVKI